MDEVVPPMLQRLKATDVIRMAGLHAAGPGQDYSRFGAVQSTKRQGAVLSGIVDLSVMAREHPTLASITTDILEQGFTGDLRYQVEIEAQDGPDWIAHCTCSSPQAFCEHAAALLYQWITHPLSFDVIVSSPAPETRPLLSATTAVLPSEMTADGARGRLTTPKAGIGTGQFARLTVLRDLGSDEGIVIILNQLGLSDLRGIAREYDVPASGRNKQQLSEALGAAIKQPEAIRKVVGTLDKPQRQLIAALTLAGGSIPHEDLQGLAERLKLGTPAELQNILVVLQNKGLLFRTTSNNTQSRIGMTGALLDMVWVVPAEVRSALRVTVPIALFDVSDVKATNGHAPELQESSPGRLLSDLLLTARALQNQPVEHNSSRITTSLDNPGQSSRYGTSMSDSSMVIPAPSDAFSQNFLRALRKQMDHQFTLAFLRFALRLLRLSGILYQDETAGTWQALPNAAQVLLDISHLDLARDLFRLWLDQSSYDELFELQEDGLQLRCRTTAVRQPALRPGELSGENKEARQALMSLIAQVPSDQWINFNSFASFVYKLSPYFLQRRQRLYPTPHWWFEQQEGRPLRPAQFNEWLLVEGRYLARLLQGALHWWGICDIARTSDRKLLAFRLNAHASVLLRDSAGSQAEEVMAFGHRTSEQLPLQITEAEDLLLSAEPASWPILQQLEPFAESAGTRGRRLVYRLSPRSLSAAFNRGLRPDALLDLLRDYAERFPEQAESYLHLVGKMERWLQNYAQMRLYTGVSFVEVADAMVLRELNATTSLESQMVQAPEPQVLILRRQGAESLLDELKRRGLAPLVHQEDNYGSE
ncbi:MAG TPA: helicase-associated domain-containing protein [Ktedonobacteraceae bacterium]|nr:helicase-associated domain-containing protein [Ktedonobacteraceae bacterium]